MSATSMLATARRDLGMTGRPNKITRDYSSRNGAVYLRAPWCMMSITEWARASGNMAAVLPHGDRAYTVYSAQDGEQLGRWHAGTAANLLKYGQPGSPIYFDWQFTDRISAIDHVGLIEKVLPDGRVQTIEGNSGDAVKRRVRSASVIAGFWVPNYDNSKDGPATRPPAKVKNWTEALVDALPLLKKGAKGYAVKRMFYLLMSQGYPLDPKVLDATVMSDSVVAQLKAFQKAEKLTVDGECGPATWSALIKP